MATTRRRLPPRIAGRVVLAASASFALVVVGVLNPAVVRVEAADVFSAFREPGQLGFVAGHRGDNEGAPENTIPAFLQAIAGSAEFVETDIQLTSDGVPVLMHDWTLDRTTDGTGPVWTKTYDELRGLDAGSWYAPEFAGERIPTLEDLLDLVRPSHKRAILELKGSWTTDQLIPVVGEIVDHGLETRVIIAGFDITSLRAAQQLAPDIQRAVIMHDVLGDPATLVATCGAVAIVTSKAFLLADPSAVTRIHAAGIGVLAYTLNSENAWSEAIALGVDGIITDKPTELDEWVATDGDLANTVETAPR
jgi:glycerophosphoryl diester phosphodiesterase